MNHILTKVMLAALALAIALPLAADDQEKKKKKGAKKGERQVQLVARVIKVLGDDLSDEQTAKLKDISAEYAPKLAEAGKGLDRKAIAAARKKAAEDGKKGRELNAAVLGSLTDEQKKAYEAQQEVNVEIRAAVAKVLTPEQQEKTKIRPPRKPGKNKKKKDDNA